jgi:uncharacterized protein YceH (UPF0502 family)
VVCQGSPTAVRRVAGADISVDRIEKRGTGAVVLLSYPELEVVETTTVEMGPDRPESPSLRSRVSLLYSGEDMNELRERIEQLTARVSHVLVRL